MNAFKRILPDIIAIVVFAVISFAYFCPAVTEGRILSQHDSVAMISGRILLNAFITLNLFILKVQRYDNS